MNSNEKDIRCQGCNTLLAKLGDSGLTIRRSELQATVDGEFRATLVCYQHRCRALNIFELSTERRRTTALPPGDPPTP